LCSIVHLFVLPEQNHSTKGVRQCPWRAVEPGPGSTAYRAMPGHPADRRAMSDLVTQAVVKQVRQDRAGSRMRVRYPESHRRSATPPPRGSSPRAGTSSPGARPGRRAARRTTGHDLIRPCIARFTMPSGTGTRERARLPVRRQLPCHPPGQRPGRPPGRRPGRRRTRTHARAQAGPGSPSSTPPHSGQGCRN